MVLCCVGAGPREGVTCSHSFLWGIAAALHDCTPYSGDRTRSTRCSFLGLGQWFWLGENKQRHISLKTRWPDAAEQQWLRASHPKGKRKESRSCFFFTFPLDFDFTLFFYPNSSTIVLWTPQSPSEGTLLSLPPGSHGGLCVAEFETPSSLEKSWTAFPVAVTSKSQTCIKERLKRVAHFRGLTWNLSTFIIQSGCFRVKN